MEPKAHRVFRHQCVCTVYDFLPFKEQIRMQLLNRYHYEEIIPLFINRVYLRGYIVISLQFQQAMVYNYVTKSPQFFSHIDLVFGLRRYSFAHIRD